MLAPSTTKSSGPLILENSLSSKPPTKSPLLASPSLPPRQTDELNSWDFCNPSNFSDVLPQPFRLITHILEETLLKRVFSEVFLIEKHKNNANYEGNVKEIASSGSFELEGASFMAFPQGNPYNQLLAGDFFGNVFLLDMNKKVQISRFSVVPGRRVLKIAANTVKDEEFLTTIAVICRADANVHVFRYKAGENKVFKSFSLSLLRKPVADDKNMRISLFPCDCSLSSDSRFVAISLYNGNIEVFQLPEPQFAAISATNAPVDTKFPGKSAKLAEIQEKKPANPVINLENSQVLELTEPFYSVSARFPLKNRDYQATLKQFLENFEKSNAISPNPEETAKKDAKKPAISTKPEPISTSSSDFEANEAPFLGETLKNDKDADISQDFPLPEFRADAYFCEETLVLAPESKTFAKVQEFRVVSGLIVANLGQKLVDFHRFQTVCKENLPSFLQNRLQIAEKKDANPANPGNIAQKPEAKKLQAIAGSSSTNAGFQANVGNLPVSAPKAELFERKLAKSFEVLYKISCSAVNKSRTFLALGLVDGSVFVFDLLLGQEHSYMDKHVATVTHIRFFEEWTVVSGSSDGSIHCYNIKENALMMKRTNIFKPDEGLEIRGLEISEAGLAVVVDNRGNARVYDVVHGEKIIRLLPVAIMEESKKTWKIVPNSIICAQKEQFCLVVNQQSSSTEAFPSNGSILIYRVFDNLLHIFPGLANLSRRGIAREKLFNAFQRMTLEDLRNPQFEIPILSNNVPENKENKASKTLVSIQFKSGLKSLPVIDENEYPTTTKLQEKVTKNPTKNQTKPNNLDSASSMTFSKLHTKESEINSSFDINSSFKSIPPATNIGKTHNKAKKTDNNAGLTNEALHPENILHDSKRLPAPELYHPVKDPIQQSLNLTRDKLIRQENMEKTLNKITKDLEALEIKNNLKKKKELLKNSLK